MQTHLQTSDVTFNDYPLKVINNDKIDNVLQSWSMENIAAVVEKATAFKNFFQQNLRPNLDDLLTTPRNKKSFLVFKHHKYLTVPTENIAFFFVKNESSIIACFNRQEYSVDYSLEQIQNLVADKQFFRLNRQYLVNFNAVKEVEHYFARKLLVNLVVPARDKLLVSKKKASSFLHWLENR